MIREPSEKQLSLPGFETPFEQSLDSSNRWVKLAAVIPWAGFQEAYHRVMSADQGRPSKTARLVIGAVIIKHRQKWTDEETVMQIQENPYLQYFCGFSCFTLKQPFAPSLFVEIRKRLGTDVFGNLETALRDKFQAIEKAKEEAKKKQDDGDDGRSNIEENKKSEQQEAEPEPVERLEHSDVSEETAGQDDKPKHRGKLIIDATVAEQAIRYPTDLGTLNEAREISEKLIDRLYPMSGLQKKPRTYRQKARQDFLALVKKGKPRRQKIRQAIRKQLQYLRRNLGHIDGLLDRYAPQINSPLGGLMPIVGQRWPDCLKQCHIRKLWVIRTVYDQQKKMYDDRSLSHPHRIVSISQPHVRPIVRGKAGKSVEFGAKLSASLDSTGLAYVDELRWDAFNESKDLSVQVEAYRKRYGYYPESVLADGIYGTRDNRRYCKELGIRFGVKPLGRPKKVTTLNKEEIRQEKRQRRQDHLERIPIEGKFGQGKNRHGLEKIRAKLAETSEAWIRAIFLVMNLRVLLKLLFSRKSTSRTLIFVSIQALIASLLRLSENQVGLIANWAGRYGWLQRPRRIMMLAF